MRLVVCDSITTYKKKITLTNAHVRQEGLIPLQYLSLRHDCERKSHSKSLSASMDCTQLGRPTLLGFVFYENLIADFFFQKLLGKGIMARCEDQHFDGFTPLHFAVTGGYSQLVDALLASGMCTTGLCFIISNRYAALNAAFWTPVAVIQLKKRTIRSRMCCWLSAIILMHKDLLLGTGVPIDVKDKYCQTPLHLAAQLGYDDLVQVRHHSLSPLVERRMQPHCHPKNTAMQIRTGYIMLH